MKISVGWVEPCETQLHPEGVIDSAKLTLRERPSFKCCGCTVNIPAVGEGVVTDVGGGGGEGGYRSFFDVGVVGGELGGI